MVGKFSSVFVCLVAALFLESAFGGQLDDLEKKSVKQSSSSSSATVQSSSYEAPSSSASSGYSSGSDGGSFPGEFLFSLLASPFRYWHSDPSDVSGTEEDDFDDDEGWADDKSGWFPKHRLGEATAPYLRADYNWQQINSDLDAEDFRIEAGYKLLAFHARHTVYTESNPSDELTINQYYALLRVGGVSDEDYASGTFEVALGLGAAQLMGNEEHASGAFTVPLKFYPADWIGFEFRPAWYYWNDRTMGDYDVSASLGHRFIQLRGGYRWLWMQGQGHLLNGPYIGLSASF